MKDEECTAEFFRTLIDSLPNLVYHAKPDSLKAIYVNKAVETFYGYTQEEWINDPSLWEKAIHPEDKKRVLEYIIKMQHESKAGAVEYRIVPKDGIVKWVSDHFVWKTNSQGKVVSFNGSLYDVTEKKLQEEELEYRNKIMVGRELRIIEIKQEVNTLSEELGRPKPYCQYPSHRALNASC